MINKTIHGYTIKHLIGSGGMADVYYAENKLGKKAAIKVLKSELCAIRTIKERFEQEARIMVDVEHKHIRQAYDLDEVNGQPAIIMEYLEGQTLKQLIDKGKISDDKAKMYFDQCVSALRVTHAKEIVHRDIKPSNIFITQDDEIKILDFGIAKLRESGLSTLSNQMLGTPVYMSPEQVKSPKNVDTKSDMYSLAVTFYHALTGKVPYDSTTDSDFEIQSKIVHEDLDMTKLSSLWRDILRPMLAKDPIRRIDINALNIGEAFNDATQYDHKPGSKSKSEIELQPKLGESTIPKWVYNLLGGIVLAVAVIVILRNCGDKNINIDERGSIVELVDTMEVSKTEVSEIDGEDKKDEAGWQEAKRFDLKTSYEQYIRKFPNGKYVSDARSRMSFMSDEEIKEEKEIKKPKVESNEELRKQAKTTIERPFIKMVSIPGTNIKMSETEVTIGQYLSFCKATNSHWPEWLEKGSEYNIYTGNKFYSNIGMSESNTNHPISGVSALNADAFCKWMGGRLPTESEWEYAANGGENYEYAGSDNIDAVAWYHGNSDGKVHQVRGKSPNGYGLYDMSGNVWEWTSSKDGPYRVNRGGGWFNFAMFCRVSYRYDYTPSLRYNYIGLRLAR